MDFCIIGVSEHIDLLFKRKNNLYVLNYYTSFEIQMRRIPIRPKAIFFSSAQAKKQPKTFPAAPENHVKE
jgi:hypothetical protein